MPGIIIALLGAGLIGYALFSPKRIVVGWRNGRPFPVSVRTVGNLENGDRAWLEDKYGTATAFEAMRDAAASDGITLSLASAFRSWEEQAALKAKRLITGDSTPTAEPGHSNHQEGTTVDIDMMVADSMTNYRSSRVWNWLRANAGSYGFVDDVYQPGNAKYEPWHWHYAQASQYISA